MRNKLDHLELISSSGIGHPYFSVSPTGFWVETMHLRVASYPPLNHATSIPYEQDSVEFYVLVESESSNAGWEVDLWHNATNSSAWDALRLEPTSALKHYSTELDSSSLNRNWYHGKLSGRQSRLVSFTIRFRSRGEEGWRWIHDQSGTEDGQLMYQQPLAALKEKHDLSHFIDGLGSSLNINNVASDTADTTVWSITATAAPAKGDQSGYSTHTFGLPSHFVRWFALVRLWSPWLAPRQGRALPLAEKEAILYAFQRKDGLHVVAIAISGIDDVLTMLNFEHGKIVVTSRNDREEEGVARVSVAVGNTFEEANAAAIYYARRVVTQYSSVAAEMQKISEQQALQQGKGDSRTSWIQDWIDGFSFCTWNSLGQNLTEEKILGALKSLEDRGIKISNLIIDDNWQSLDNEGQNQNKRGWTDFEANKHIFPKGLKAGISNIRKLYPGIRYIAVWHAILGYWGAISPHGKIAQNYKTIEVQKRDGVAGGRFTVVDAPDVKRFYKDFYDFLLSAGVDAAKTDAQFFLDEIDTAPERRALMSTYLSTWMQVQLGYLGGHAISCMSQTPQILFSCQLPKNSPAIPVRNSDDFFPDVEESHPWHIFCNAHNALFAQHLNVFPDWDMFQTQHKWAKFHAAARCVSGGPIYVTDEPGKHDVDLIASMTATTSLGQTVILRPSVVGRSVEPYIGYEEDRFCKVAAYDGAAGTGSSFLGVFNCRDYPITEIISLKDFIGVEKDRKYILTSHNPSQNLLEVMSTTESRTALFGLTLRGHDCAVLTHLPVYGPYDISDELKGVQVANFGLLRKMTGAAAIISTKVAIHDPNTSTTASPATRDQIKGSYARLFISTLIKALGTLGILILNIENINWKERTLVLLADQPMPIEFARMSDTNKGLLELDIEGAWNHLQPNVGWSNEIGVQIFVG